MLMCLFVIVDTSLRQNLLVDETDEISVITNDGPITPSSISSSRSYADNHEYQESNVDLYSNLDAFKRDVHSAVSEIDQIDNRMLHLGCVY